MASWQETRVTIVGPTIIKYQGIYDFEKLLKEMQAWLKKTGYFIKYKDQTEEPKPQGTFIRMELICDRQPTPYFKFYIETEMVCRDQIEVIVEHNGKKQKRIKGDMELIVKAYVDKNYDNKFPSTLWGKFCRVMWERYVAYDSIKGFYGRIYSETYQFLDVIKAVLEGFKS